MSIEKKAQAAAAGAGNASSTSPSQPAPGKHNFTRRFPRFVIDVRLQVKMFQAGEFRTCWGRSTEMGQDGIGATLTGSLEPGEIVTLEIPLPLTPYPIKVRAIVRYRQGLRYGFEFLTLNDNQRDTIKRVCQYLATKS
ncbi:MAG TPA: PilZ domain-containing protein [Candidatus Binatia bacterium]|nr:PilZ domain-containing protein [Candidatus Binatia bacterium]